MEPQVVTPGPKLEFRDIFLKALIFVVIPILVIFITVGIYLVVRGSRPQENVSTSQVDQEVSPWAYAGDDVTKPTTPDLVTLDEKYKAVQDAISNRDYEAFKELASSERIWHVENPKKLVNEAAGGEAVYETLTPKGKENFVRYSPYSILFKAPFRENVFPIQVVEKEPSTRPDIILVDGETNERTRVKAIVWKYTVELYYRTNDDYRDEGFGYVSFVWDKSDWKYNGEYWDLSTHTTPVDTGDVGSEVATTLNIGENGICSPKNVVVSVGSGVLWQGVTGRVYSIDSSPEYWDSGFLYSDKFTKRFDAPGTYTYLIQQIPNQPEDSQDCTVTVE